MSVVSRTDERRPQVTTPARPVPAGHRRGGEGGALTARLRGLSARGIRLGLLLACAVVFAGPLLWLVLAATKTQHQIYTANPFSFGSFANLPREWAHLMQFNHGELIVWLVNSIVYSAISVALALVLCLPAGYALSKFQFPGRRLIFVTTLIAMVIPEAALVLPLYLEMNLVHLVNSPLAVILPLALYPFGVYLSYLYFGANLPTSIVQAARIDGASELAIFMRIAVPTAKPLIGMVAFFSFVRTWTNFFLPYVMLASDHKFTLQLGLMDLLESTGAINPQNAVSSLPIYQPEAALAALLTIAPVVLAFVFSQRHLANSQFAGAEKG